MKHSQRFFAGLAAGLAVAVIGHARRARRAIAFSERSVVIIGGSRGLGLVIARQLVAERARLVLIARDPDELDRARLDLEEQGSPVMVIPCDIRERREVDRAVEAAAAEHGGIDVLINDAGVIQVGPVEHMQLRDFEDAMASHFWGPLHAILAALPHLRRSDAPRIVNVSSIGGKVAVPHLLPYSASKFALAGLSDGLRAELARDGIRVTSVYPGLMRTGSTYNALFKGQHRREFTWFHVADSLPGLSTSAERAARQIVDACRHGDAELVITLPARLAVLANALAPGMVARAMALTNRLLPDPTGADGDEPREGWQSMSDRIPSAWTRLADRATLDNNEVPQSS
jgi:NAD(P)-dependent dehydrogenase (short-subunit alcohol dehydrogenase family)